MSAGTLSRLFAPVALIVAALAVVLIVAASAGNGESKSSTSTNSRTSTQGQPAAKPKPKTYTVKEGDNLSIIAQKTGISVDRIETLNPDVDPQALTVGQKLKIRP